MTAAAAIAPARPVPDRADAAAWLAVAAGSIGAMMATLDISIVNSALPVIQGEIGATGTEGTWIATAYLVAEIIVIPLAAWLERLIGLRTLLLAATTLFTAFSILCATAGDLTTMIVGRAGQGFSGGVLIPTAMTIVATRLPPSQQPIGGALFGVTAVLGPVLGPLVGGWLTEGFSWHYAFFLNVPIGALLIVLLMVGLPHQRARLADLFDADWLGIVGMVVGLGCMTVVLEEGQREQWFDSPSIAWLTLAAVVGFALLFAGQRLARRPVIALHLLLDRQFGAVAIMAVVLGMVLYGSAFVIPQFLAVVADYNALQSGHVVLLAGLPTLVLMPFTPLLLRHVDIRLSVGIGLAIMAASCWIDTALTVESSGDAFTVSQLMRGVGTILCFLFLNQAAISSVDRSVAADAAGLFNAARNIGGSMVLAAISTVQDQRLSLHSRRMEETLAANAPAVQDHVATLTRALGGAEAAMLSLSGTIGLQALVMTYNDVFLLLAIGIAACAPLVLLLRPLPKNLSLTPIH